MKNSTDQLEHKNLNKRFLTSNIRSSICEKYKFAAINLANKQTSLVTSGVTLGFPVSMYL